MKTGTILKTRKFPVTHYGIYAGNGFVIDNSPADQGVTKRSLSEFAGSAGFAVHRFPANSAEGQVWISTAERFLGRPYNAVSFNCEHFVSLATTNKPSSKQVAAASFGALAGGLVSQRPIVGLLVGAFTALQLARL
ncbi:lecithin retinol acyltransferase family protein [Aliiroseovarius sp.]|uniref:lecithin retinol acyltransferase family protein n=1 Tax=Aliiroseovarius sp. TaxID=1872442 RepID=UPI003BAA9971